MTVTTVFSTAISDGYIQSQNASYALCRAGSSQVVNDTDTEFSVGQLVFGIFVINQGFCRYDTSAISVTDLVSSAVHELFWTSDFTDTNFTMRVRAYDYGSPLFPSDFVPGASISTTGTHVASLAAGGGSLGTYLTLTNVALPANINKGDITSLYYYSLEQENNSAPGGNEFLGFSSADEAGTTQDPKITVTHAATTSRIPYSGTPFRIWPRRS